MTDAELARTIYAAYKRIVGEEPRVQGASPANMRGDAENPPGDRGQHGRSREDRQDACRGDGGLTSLAELITRPRPGRAGSGLHRGFYRRFREPHLPQAFFVQCATQSLLPAVAKSEESASAFFQKFGEE